MGVSMLQDSQRRHLGGNDWLTLQVLDKQGKTPDQSQRQQKF